MRWQRTATKLTKNWHVDAPLQWWGDVPGAPGGTNEQRAERLRALFDDANCRLTPFERRALSLDLMCASFPAGHPPPDGLVRLMKKALGLPDDHEVGGWMICIQDEDDHVHGRQGGPDIRMQLTAARIDREYFETHEKEMPARALARELQRRLGRENEVWHTNISKLRKNTDYRRWACLPPFDGPPEHSF